MQSIYLPPFRKICCAAKTNSN